MNRTMDHTAEMSTADLLRVQLMNFMLILGNKKFLKDLRLI